MAELTATDVELYSRGRLRANDVETTRLLNRALVAARRYCEWHVTPVIPNDVVTLEGSGDRVLVLPTMNVVTLHSVTEAGVILAENVDFRVSRSFGKWSKGPVRLRKSFARWGSSWTDVVVNMTHGLPEDEAQDWRVAVLDSCDRFAKLSNGGLKSLAVDDVSQTWFDNPETAFNTRLLDPYRIQLPQ